MAGQGLEQATKSTEPAWWTRRFGVGEGVFSNALVAIVTRTFPTTA